MSIAGVTATVSTSPKIVKSEDLSLPYWSRRCGNSLARDIIKVEGSKRHQGWLIRAKMRASAMENEKLAHCIVDH